MTALRLWKLLSAPSSPNYVSMFIIPVKYKLRLSFSRNFGVIFSSLCNFLRGSTSICCVCFSLWGIGYKIQVQWSELTACPTIIHWFLSLLYTRSIFRSVTPEMINFVMSGINVMFCPDYETFKSFLWFKHLALNRDSNSNAPVPHRSAGR